MSLICLIPSKDQVLAENNLSNGVAAVLKKMDMKAKIVAIKLKKTNYEVITRFEKAPDYVKTGDEIYQIAAKLLKTAFPICILSLCVKASVLAKAS